MTHKKPRQHTNPAETIQDLANTKRQQAQQTPGWPGAKEHAEPQHAPVQAVDEAAPGELEKTPPSKSGYERSDINKRHH